MDLAARLMRQRLEVSPTEAHEERGVRERDWKDVLQLAKMKDEERSEGNSREVCFPRLGNKN